jgi:hypothetical protein
VERSSLECGDDGNGLVVKSALVERSSLECGDEESLDASATEQVYSTSSGSLPAVTA